MSNLKTLIGLTQLLAMVGTATANCPTEIFVERTILTPAETYRIVSRSNGKMLVMPAGVERAIEAEFTKREEDHRVCVSQKWPTQAFVKDPKSGLTKVFMCDYIRPREPVLSGLRCHMSQKK